MATSLPPQRCYAEEYLQSAWNSSDKRCTLSTKYHCHILYNAAIYRSVPFSREPNVPSAFAWEGKWPRRRRKLLVCCSSLPRGEREGEQGPQWGSSLCLGDTRGVSLPAWDLAVKPTHPQSPQARPGMQQDQIPQSMLHLLSSASWKRVGWQKDAGGVTPGEGQESPLGGFHKTPEWALYHSSSSGGRQQWEPSTLRILCCLSSNHNPHTRDLLSH